MDELKTLAVLTPRTRQVSAFCFLLSFSVFSSQLDAASSVRVHAAVDGPPDAAIGVLSRYHQVLT